jgi:hypothetical protein
MLSSLPPGYLTQRNGGHYDGAHEIGAHLLAGGAIPYYFCAYEGVIPTLFVLKGPGRVVALIRGFLFLRYKDRQSGVFNHRKPIRFFLRLVENSQIDLVPGLLETL